MSDKEVYDNFRKVSNEKIALLIDFVKTILIMLSTVLSVIISFYNDNKSKNEIAVQLFVITIILFGISIILGSLYLYGFFKLKRKEEIYCGKQIDALYTNKIIKAEIIGAGKLFSYFGRFFYISSILSIISLITYSVFKVL